MIRPKFPILIGNADTFHSVGGLQVESEGLLLNTHYKNSYFGGCVGAHPSKAALFMNGALSGHASQWMLSHVELTRPYHLWLLHIKIALRCGLLTFLRRRLQTKRIELILKLQRKK